MTHEKLKHIEQQMEETTHKSVFVEQHVRFGCEYLIDKNTSRWPKVIARIPMVILTSDDSDIMPSSCLSLVHYYCTQAVWWHLPWHRQADFKMYTRWILFGREAIDWSHSIVWDVAPESEAIVPAVDFCFDIFRNHTHDNNRLRQWDLGDSNDWRAAVQSKKKLLALPEWGN